MRSSAVSPMPIKIPVVNAIDNLPGLLDRLQSSRRHFVRRLPVRALRSANFGAGAFQHQPKADVGLPQAFRILRVHDTGIRVRQQSRFIKHKLRHRRQIFEGTLEPLLSQKPLGLGEYRLRLIAQAKERLFASSAAPGFGRRKNFLRCHV